MPEQSIKLCRNSCCPHLHLSENTARITDDYNGEIIESTAQMNCIVNHLRLFLSGDENCCNNIIKQGEFTNIYGHAQGCVKLTEDQAQIFINKWSELISGDNVRFDITTPISESVLSSVGSSV